MSLSYLRRSPELVIGASVMVLLLSGRPAQAQTAANASVTATVAQPLAVSATAPLAFGTVVPGTNETVTVSDAAAAAFTITGNALGVVSLTLPSCRSHCAKVCSLRDGW